MARLKGNGRRSLIFCLGLSFLGASFTSSSEIDLPLGIPPLNRNETPNGDWEISQRLIPYPFFPSGLIYLNDEGLSRAHDWYRPRDKRWIDRLGMMDFYAESGPHQVGVVPKLHNTSAGIEIYELPAGMEKSYFQSREGPYRSGRTREYMNKRPGRKLAKLKFKYKAQSGLAYFHVSRILGKLVEVPPATYRTMGIDEFERVASQSRKTGNRFCTYSWSALRGWVQRKDPQVVTEDGAFVYGCLAENIRGEFSSPPSYWTLGRIRRKSFYRLLTSSKPISENLDYSDPDAMQKLALAQDLVRGAVLDEIFRQADRLGNITTERLYHWVDYEGIVRWNDNLSTEDRAGKVTRIVEMDRLIFKDNDDGMMWGRSSTGLTPVIRETRHLDPLLYQRLQWFAGLMRDEESQTNQTSKAFFTSVVRISEWNYEKMRESVIEVADELKDSVESGRIQLDLDFSRAFKRTLLEESSKTLNEASAPY
ncbi:MAG: hypothetical protein AAF236_08450 [Verrucomicrobiota bacterium]